jgi:hypothetical protein
MVLNFIVAITVSRFTLPPPIDVQIMIEDIRSGEVAMSRYSKNNEDSRKGVRSLL